MSTLMTQLGIDKLPRDRRIKLVRDIQDSVDAEDSAIDSRMQLRDPNDTSIPPLSDAQIAELRRRVADMEANPDDQEPADEVIARLLAKWQ